MTDVPDGRTRNLISLPQELQRKIYSYMVPIWSLAIFNSQEYHVLPETVLLNRKRSTAFSIIPGIELALTCKKIHALLVPLQEESFDGVLYCGNVRRSKGRYPFRRWFAYVHTIYHVQSMTVFPAKLLAKFQGIRKFVSIKMLHDESPQSAIGSLTVLRLPPFSEIVKISVSHATEFMNRSVPESRRGTGWIAQDMILEIRLLREYEPTNTTSACHGTVMYFPISVESGQYKIDMLFTPEKLISLGYRRKKMWEVIRYKVDPDLKLMHDEDDDEIFTTPIDWTMRREDQKAHVKAVESRLEWRNTFGPLLKSVEGFQDVAFPYRNRSPRPTTPDVD